MNQAYNIRLTNNTFIWLWWAQVVETSVTCTVTDNSLFGTTLTRTIKLHDQSYSFMVILPYVTSKWVWLFYHSCKSTYTNPSFQHLHLKILWGCQHSIPVSQLIGCFKVFFTQIFSMLRALASSNTICDGPCGAWALYIAFQLSISP